MFPSFLSFLPPPLLPVVLPLPPSLHHHLFHPRTSSGEFYVSYFICEYFFIGSRLNWQSCNEMPFHCSSRSRHLPPSALSFHNTYTHTHTHNGSDTQSLLCIHKETHTHTHAHTVHQTLQVVNQNTQRRVQQVERGLSNPVCRWFHRRHATISLSSWREREGGDKTTQLKFITRLRLLLALLTVCLSLSLSLSLSHLARALSLSALSRLHDEGGEVLGWHSFLIISLLSDMKSVKTLCVHWSLPSVKLNPLRQNWVTSSEILRLFYWLSHDFILTSPPCAFLKKCLNQRQLLFIVFF